MPYHLHAPTSRAVFSTSSYPLALFFHQRNWAVKHIHHFLSPVSSNPFDFHGYRSPIPSPPTERSPSHCVLQTRTHRQPRPRIHLRTISQSCIVECSDGSMTIDEALLKGEENAKEINERLRTLGGWENPDLNFVGVLQMVDARDAHEDRVGAWLDEWKDDYWANVEFERMSDEDVEMGNVGNERKKKKHEDKEYEEDEQNESRKRSYAGL